MRKKTNIVFYSGHCEIVGGDAKYLFELISNLNLDKYNIKVYSDINSVFETRAQQWLSSKIPINYIDTRPRLFNDNINSLNIFNSIIQSGNNSKSKSNSIQRICKKIKIRMDYLFYDFHNFLLFRKIFRDNKQIDIFHFNNGGYPGKTAGLWAFIAAKTQGVNKTVMTLQNLPLKRTYFSKLNIPDYYNYIYDWITRSFCNVIITVAGNRLHERMSLQRKYPADRLRTIYHGLDNHMPLNRKQIKRKKKEFDIPILSPVLIITANIEEPRKGHAILFKALKQVSKKYPNVILLVVGDGTKKYQLLELSCELSLEKNILFLGYRSDIAELNDISDIAIVPSIEFEGIPYTIREAMRSGKPVITTRAGGCDEAVEHGKNGLIFEENNVDALSEAILTIIEDKDLRISMGEKSRELFLEKFLLKDKIREHEKLYDQLISNI